MNPDALVRLLPNVGQGARNYLLEEAAVNSQ